jgi:hypothetical protein
MIVAGEPWDEERNCTVADEFVDDAVAFVDHPRCCPVEAGQQARELLGFHPLGDCGRPTHVREQHRDLDLGTARMLAHCP